MHHFHAARMGTNKRITKARQILASNMRRRRAELEMSQEKLAEVANLHRTYISSVERCQRNIGVDGVERIAKALKLKISELWAE
jgi:transcriptional regulator with XRE-family HTH domain